MTPSHFILHYENTNKIQGERRSRDPMVVGHTMTYMYVIGV